MPRFHSLKNTKIRISQQFVFFCARQGTNAHTHYPNNHILKLEILQQATDNNSIKTY